MVYRMFFLGRDFMSGLICTLKWKQDAVLSQGGPRDATVNFDTTALCGFSVKASISCCTAVTRPICQQVTSTRKNQSIRSHS